VLTAVGQGTVTVTATFVGVTGTDQISIGS
jgi:hypothetical protein